MRRRTKRRFLFFLCATFVFLVIAFVNTQLRRSNLYDHHPPRPVPPEPVENTTFLKWDTLRDTKGKLRTGAEYTDELKEYDGERVSVYGFQVPEKEYDDVSTFFLLPIPIECFYCSLPPPRDVLLVHMENSTSISIFNEPILLTGLFTLKEGAELDAFYELTDARLEDLEGHKPTKRVVSLEHQLGGEKHPGMSNP